jgi:hypothetical protein
LELQISLLKGDDAMPKDGLQKDAADREDAKVFIASLG